MVLRESDKFSRHQKYPDTRQDAVAVHCSVGLARRTSLFVQFPNVKDPPRTNLLSLSLLSFPVRHTTTHNQTTTLARARSRLSKIAVVRIWPEAHRARGRSRGNPRSPPPPPPPPPR